MLQEKNLHEIIYNFRIAQTEQEVFLINCGLLIFYVILVYWFEKQIRENGIISINIWLIAYIIFFRLGIERIPMLWKMALTAIAIHLGINILLKNRRRKIALGNVNDNNSDNSRVLRSKKRTERNKK